MPPPRLMDQPCSSARATACAHRLTAQRSWRCSVSRRSSSMGTANCQVCDLPLALTLTRALDLILHYRCRDVVVKTERFDLSQGALTSIVPPTINRIGRSTCAQG